VGLSWSQLALALPDMGEASGSFLEKHQCSPPGYKTLAMQTHNIGIKSKVNLAGKYIGIDT